MNQNQNETRRCSRNHAADADSPGALIKGHPSARGHRGCLRETAVVRAAEGLAGDVDRDCPDNPKTNRLVPSSNFVCRVRNAARGIGRVGVRDSGGQNGCGGSAEAWKLDTVGRAKMRRSMTYHLDSSGL